MNADAATTSLIIFANVGPDRTQEGINLFNKLLENGSEKIQDDSYSLMIFILKSLNSFQVASFTRQLTEEIVSNHRKALRLAIEVSEE